MSRPADPTAKISLLRAAEAVFAERGLPAAKVEDITRRAGLSKGAFYLHFESKEEAFKHVVESFLSHCTAMYQPPRAYEDLPANAEAMLDFWLERDTQMFEFLWQNRSIVAILAGCQGPYTYLLETFRAGVQKTSEEWVEHSKAQGLLRRDLDTELVATLISGAYHELSHKMLTFPRRPPIGDWLRQSMTTFMGGLGTPVLTAALRHRERNGAQRDPHEKRDTHEKNEKRDDSANRRHQAKKPRRLARARA
jgi:AcrR family transcriptional regulator